MPDAILTPTSSAATKDTEPEVVAAICSAEGSPGTPWSIRVAGFELGIAHTALMLAAGAGAGYLAARFLCSSRG